MNRLYQVLATISPRRLVFLAVVATLVSGGILGTSLFISFRKASEEFELSDRLDDLSDDLLLYEESQATSAKMAITTGSKDWEIRYEQADRVLNKAMESSLKLVPGSIHNLP